MEISTVKRNQHNLLDKRAMAKGGCPLNELQSNPVERVEWISAARAITILLVIIGHCTYYKIISNYGGIDFQYGKQENVCMSAKALDYLNQFIYIFHMPMFSMISGMCFNWTLHKITGFYELIQNKYHRLIIPFVFTTILIAVPIKYISGYWAQSTNVFKDIIFGQILLGGNTHLWFLISIFEVFVASYIFNKSVSKPHKLYFLILFLIACAARKASIYTNYNWFGIIDACRLWFFFEIGRYFLSWYNSHLRWSGWKASAFMLVYMALASVMFYLGGHIKHGFGLMLIPYNLLALFGCTLLVSFAKQITNMPRMKNMIDKLNRDSFGMYLFSDPYNYLILFLVCPFFKEQMLTDDGLTIILFIGRIFFTIIISIIITKLIRDLKI